MLAIWSLVPLRGKVKVKLLSRVWLFATPWTVACQVPLSMEFSRQFHNSTAVPFPRESSQPRDWTKSPALQADAFHLWVTRAAHKLGLILMGGAKLSKSLIQFSVDGQGCVPSLLFDLRPNYGEGFPGDSEVKPSASSVGDLGLIPGSGSSPGEGNGNPLHYFYLENPMDRGSW